MSALRRHIKKDPAHSRKVLIAFFKARMTGSFERVDDQAIGIYSPCG
jgi:hypothetical protein